MKDFEGFTKFKRDPSDPTSLLEFKISSDGKIWKVVEHEKKYRGVSIYFQHPSSGQTYHIATILASILSEDAKRGALMQAQRVFHTYQNPFATKSEIKDVLYVRGSAASGGGVDLQHFLNSFETLQGGDWSKSKNPQIRGMYANGYGGKVNYKVYPRRLRYQVAKKSNGKKRLRESGFQVGNVIIQQVRRKENGNGALETLQRFGLAGRAFHDEMKHIHKSTVEQFCRRNYLTRSENGSMVVNPYENVNDHLSLCPDTGNFKFDVFSKVEAENDLIFEENRKALDEMKVSSTG